jgi:hypothetical protein
MALELTRPISYESILEAIQAEIVAGVKERADAWAMLTAGDKREHRARQMLQEYFEAIVLEGHPQWLRRDKTGPQAKYRRAVRDLAYDLAQSARETAPGYAYQMTRLYESSRVPQTIETTATTDAPDVPLAGFIEAEEV